MFNDARTRFLALSAPALAVALIACGTDTPAPDIPGAGHPATSMTPSVAVDDATAAPTDIEWIAFQGIDLPYTDQGPERVDGAYVTGFDHTPAGAALAAVHASVRVSIATDTQWSLVAEHMIAPGPGRDSWAVSRAQISITAPLSDEKAPTIVGYRVTDYTPQTAVVDIYARHPDDSLTAHHTRVRYVDGDWRLDMPDPATGSRPTVTGVTDLPADMVPLPH